MLPAAVGVAISPLPIVAVVLTLVSARGRANGPGRSWDDPAAGRERRRPERAGTAGRLGQLGEARPRRPSIPARAQAVASSAARCVGARVAVDAECARL